MSSTPTSSIKRISVFAGHYGSGKTNIAVNFSLNLAKMTDARVTLHDLDIVNPYFRTADSKEILDVSGVKLVSSEFANTNVEGTPLPYNAISAFDNPGDYEIFDIGGDDVGALALSRFNKWLKNADADIFLVMNMMRPLCSDAKSTLESMRTIEHAARINFTGIINNTNLGRETTTEIILDSLPKADDLSQMTGLPIVFTTVRTDLAVSLKNKIANIYPIDIYLKPGWDIYRNSELI